MKLEFNKTNNGYFVKVNKFLTIDVIERLFIERFIDHIKMDDIVNVSYCESEDDIHYYFIFINFLNF